MLTQHDQLIAKPKVAKRFGVNPRTITNWLSKPKLCFPKPAVINGRNYFSLAELEIWQASRKPGAAISPAASSAPALAFIDPTPPRTKRPIDRIGSIELEA